MRIMRSTMISKAAAYPADIVLKSNNLPPGSLILNSKVSSSKINFSSLSLKSRCNNFSNLSNHSPICKALSGWLLFFDKASVIFISNKYYTNSSRGLSEIKYLSFSFTFSIFFGCGDEKSRAS